MIQEKKEKSLINTINKSFLELRHIKLKVTDSCNLRCPKCDFWKYSPSNNLTTDIIESLIKQGVKLGLKTIHLSGGEPTIRKDLLRLVEYGSKKEISFGIVTNGTYLNPEQNLELAKAGIKTWTFSLDTADPSDFYESVGRTISIDKVKENIKYMSNNKHSHNLKVNILTVVTSNNYSKLEEIATLAKSLDVNSFKIMPYDYRQNNINGGTSTLNELNLNKEQIKYFNKFIVPSLETFSKKNNLLIYPSYSLNIFGKTSKEIELSSNGDVALGYYDSNTCFMPWIHLSIFPSGDAYICCKKTYVPLGNVQTHSILEIIGGQKMNEARKLFVNNAPLDSCKSCTSNAYENRILGGTL